MRVAMLGGTGAMGGLYGARLAEGGCDVALVDVNREAVERVSRSGLRIEAAGEATAYTVPATTDASTVGVVDVVIVFVKCYDTVEAVRAASPMIGDDTVVLSLQNGWGNAPRIADIVGADRVAIGVSYHSATAVGPGHIQHAGTGKTFLGELDGGVSKRVTRIAGALNNAGMEAEATDQVLRQVWSKLSLNVCTLPTSAVLRFTADQLIADENVRELMREILAEAVAVANARDIPLDFDERWATITDILTRAVGGKASMLQDVENKRRTEIDVISAAVSEMGAEAGIATPYNETMTLLVKTIEDAYFADE
ncbi:2-dehydropantoate 2-reductase [Candidatus Poribacteria bacterium]|nr:2-dehydropantoate 2-reductase [Candidatus Poribacteria bacterium]